MPEMSTAFVPKHKGDKNPNKKLLKLLRKITDNVKTKIGGVTTDDPEYWGMACIFEDEMEPEEREAALDLLLKMVSKKAFVVREVRPYKQLHEWNAKYHFTKDAESFDHLLDRVCYLGLVEYDYGDKYTKDGPIPGTTYNKEDRRYWVPLFVPGSGEYTNMNEDLMKKHPELSMFFERMTFLPLEKVTPMVPPGGSGIGMHVIPVEKAISMENQSIDIEHISYWLKRYEGHIGASICSCRHGRKTMGEGAPDDFHDWCIGVGDMADWCRETGRGHDITYEQAMEILKRAEDNGYVHQITNIDGEGKIFAICNCNVKICNALRTSQLFNTPNMSRSAYAAHVEAEKCVACGRCVEYCPAGALKLGQKICHKDGTLPEYPRQPLPKKFGWGPKDWDENYRDTARINSHKTGTSPCKANCPAHIAVQGYLKKASEGKYREALELIKKENPFPVVCGRICNRRCEQACTRGKIDEAVSIDAVKRFIAEQDLKAEHRFVPEVVVGSNLGRWTEKIAIIGGGPAGLSAAYYLATLGYYPTVFEKEKHPGGMMRYGIPSYKIEKKLIDAEIDIMKEIGVEIKTGVEVGKDVTIAELRKQGYKAFYIAIGCNIGRRPGVENDTAEGTTTALEFLHDYNCGKKKLELDKVVVVGGGNVAIDAARVSKRAGAKEVTMLSLETRDIMPASKQEQEEAIEDGVVLNPGWGPKEVLTKDGKVSGIVFKKCVSVFNEEHKFAPVYDENELLTLDADLVIFAIGQGIRWNDLLKGEDVDFWRGNYPVADAKTYQTKTPDIFVGGDVYHGPKFVIDAIAEGHEAADSLHRYARGASMTIGKDQRLFYPLDTNDIRAESYDTAGRQTTGINSAVKDPFKDNSKTLTEDQVKIETSRCLKCGVTIVDPNKCIGCGICTTKCMFDAIHLERDHPECSTMIKAEDKFKGILPYLFKRDKKVKVKKADEKSK